LNHLSGGPKAKCIKTFAFFCAFGVEKTRARARRVVYWPNINNDIKEIVEKCQICQEYSHKQQKEPLFQHEKPNSHWCKVACDFFEFGGAKWMVVVDYFSNWFEMVKMNQNTTAEALIAKLKSLFARFGVVYELICDNGPPFTSQKFKEFAEEYSFKITTSSLYYAKSNGLAEKAVSIAKNILRKCNAHEEALAEYRATPVVGVGLTPSEMMFGRLIRTKVPSTSAALQMKSKPELSSRRATTGRKTEALYNRDAKALPSLEAGQSILMKMNNKVRNWKPAVVKGICSQPRSYMVTDSQGEVFRRNRVHLRATKLPVPAVNLDVDYDVGEEAVRAADMNKELVIAPEPVLRRSNRIRRPTDRYNVSKF
jgi:hypothetical protein